MIWVILGLIALYYMGKFRQEELAADRQRGSVYIGNGYSIRFPEEPRPQPVQVTWPKFRSCQRRRGQK